MNEIKKEAIVESISKKEVQDTILPVPIQQNGKASEEEIFTLLKMIAPGTHLRTALEGALKTNHGALIMVENDEAHEVIDGGFRVNCRFTPQRFVELTKMDGAIVLSKDIKKINHANVLLTPDNKIKTLETGTRHKAAERTAKQIGTLVIAISERKHEITLYYKNIRYALRPTNELLRKASEHIQMLEKQRELFDKNIERLNALELRNYPSINKAVQVIQKGRLIQKIAVDLKKYIIELGTEGSLLKIRLKEIITDVDKETNLVIKDYTKLDIKKSRLLLDTLSYDEILDQENILSALAQEKPLQHIPIKGWRILSKTSLSEPELANLIKVAGSLGKAIHSSPSTFSPAIGGEKAMKFREDVDKIKLNY